MYCRNCGSQIDEHAVICPKCGVAQQPIGQPNNMYYPQNNVQPMAPISADTGSFGWAVLGFFFPIVGLVLYLVWKDTKPLTAKKAGWGALISVIVGFAIGILIACFWLFIVFVVFASMNSYYYW